MTSAAESQLPLGLEPFFRRFNFLGLRRIFYAVTPGEASYPSLEELPNILDESTIWFLFLLLVEIIITMVTKKGAKLYRFSDSITSMSGGLMQQMVKLVFRSIEFQAYVQLYNRYHLFELPWDSPWTWLIAAIGVDFGYYWFHRMAHEVSLMWSLHQMHHSSEYYNLSTALRQHIFQQYTSFIFYLPMAICIPPQVFAVHIYFNLLYQFWIHTQLVKSLGPLEYVLNTPSHHRVHHGRNPYCIDKNYGGTLIIWDRLFGTFAAEKDSEPVSYGLIHAVSSFDPINAQFCVLQYLFFDKLPVMKNWPDRLKTFFYGPGWEPGTERLGNPEDLPEVEDPNPRYEPDHGSYGQHLYIFIHFLLTFLFYAQLTATYDRLPAVEAAKVVSMLVLSLYCFGAFFDNKWYANWLELFRCGLLLILGRSVWAPGSSEATRATTILSGICLVSFGLILASCVRQTRVYSSQSTKDSAAKKLE